MRAFSCRRTLLLAPLVLVTAGCEIREYEVSTRLDSNGSIHREIYQPLDNTLPPEAIEESEATDAASQPASRPAVELAAKWKNRWQNIQPAAGPAGTPDLVTHDPHVESPYFRALGDFDSIVDVPASYYLPAAPLPDLTSDDLLGHTVDDYHLFGIEHWEEEITETISLSEYISAVDDFSRLLIPPLQQALDDRYGREYQLKDLHTWVQRQLTEAFRQYCLWFYQYHPASVNELSDRAVRDLKVVFALMDVDLPLTDKGDVDLDAWPDSLDESAVQIVRHNIRFKDGHELSEDEAGDLWDQIQADLGVRLSGEADDSADQTHVQKTRFHASRHNRNPEPRQGALPANFRRTEPWRSKPISGFPVAASLRRSGPGSPGRRRLVQDEGHASDAQVPHRLSQAWEKQFERMHGEDGQIELLRIDAQLGGAHHNSPVNRLRQLFGGEPVLPGMSRFSYALQTSGPIIETNGVRLADNRVRWKFTSEDLFPDGISMAARAIRWNRSAERKLFGGIVLKDIGTVVKLVDAIELDGPVEQALDDAVKQGSLSPIKDLLKDDDPKVRDAAKRIMELKR